MTAKLNFLPNQMDIRALSWKEPFASLMLQGKIETRTWNTNYRGWVLICASKQAYTINQVINISGLDPFYKRIYLQMRENAEKGINIFSGKAIAIGRLVDCRPMLPTDEDKCFVKYNPALYCHIYEDVQAIEPFAWKGSQGWRKLTADEKQMIHIKTT